MAIPEQRLHRAMMIDGAFQPGQGGAAPVRRDKVIILDEGVDQDFPAERQVIVAVRDVVN